MIRNMFKIVMTIMIAITLITCTKFGKNITVKGRVINPITGEGYEGMTVELIRSKYMQFSGGFKELNHTTTNENGEFEVSAYHAGAVLAQVQVPAEYYDLGWLNDGKYNFRTNVKKGKITQMDYHLVPYGILKLHVFNQNCQGATDSLDIFFDGSDVLTLTGKEDANNYIGSILFEPIVGCWDKTDNGFNTQMGRRFYHWTVTRNGIKTTFYDTVYVIPNSITTLNVFY
jgi:hypothetical protein